MKRFLPLLVLTGLCLFFPSPQSVSAQGDLLSLINNLRASQGLPAYTTNGALAGAAQSQAQWLVDNGCAIAHVHPDGSTPRTRAAAYGYPTVDVSENIYCGTIATSGDAWTFWINSGVHYAGLVNTRYKEIGIASASGAAGSSYVLVFGNPGGPAYVPPAASGNSSSSGSFGQPSYVLGLDEHGNILHEIQDGDTLGDIALIYGYTWDDIPNMLAMNGLTWDDIRDLEIGAVLLIPPKAGTYTPTPGDPPTATPGPTETPFEITNTPTVQDTAPTPTMLEPPVLATVTPAHVPGATLDTLPEAIAALLPTESPTPVSTMTPSDVTAVAMVSDPSTPLASTPAGVVTRPGASPWLGIALLVQVGVLVAAGFEFLRRKRRR